MNPKLVEHGWLSADGREMSWRDYAGAAFHGALIPVTFQEWRDLPKGERHYPEEWRWKNRRPA